jgi:hypothetical protein
MRNLHSCKQRIPEDIHERVATETVRKKSQLSMKRGKPLKRTGELKRSGPLRPRSKKTEDVYKKRRPLVEKLLKERPWCEACPIFAEHDNLAVYIRKPSQDIHELVRRSQGGSILDESNLLAVCRPCHQRIGEQPALAFKLGLAKHSWENNQGD